LLLLLLIALLLRCVVVGCCVVVRLFVCYVAFCCVVALFVVHVVYVVVDFVVGCLRFIIITCCYVYVTLLPILFPRVCYFTPLFYRLLITLTFRLRTFVPFVCFGWLLFVPFVVLRCYCAFVIIALHYVAFVYSTFIAFMLRFTGCFTLLVTFTFAFGHFVVVLGLRFVIVGLLIRLPVAFVTVTDHGCCLRWLYVRCGAFVLLRCVYVRCAFVVVTRCFFTLFTLVFVVVTVTVVVVVVVRVVTLRFVILRCCLLLFTYFTFVVVVV